MATRTKSKPKPKKVTAKQKSAMEQMEGDFVSIANDAGYAVPSEARDLLEMVAEMIVLAEE